MILFLKNLLFTLVVPGTVAVYGPLTIVGEAPAPTVGRLAAALPLLAAGAAVYLWCLWDFATFGRGTPAPIDAPKRLVVRGLYRWVRNPMYAGVLTVIAGWALLYGSGDLLLYAAAVLTSLHLFVLLYEEPHLRRVFGDAYDDSCRRVGRWVPRPPREAR